MYNYMLYLNSCTLSFKLYLVSTVREKKILYFLTLATEFVYCFQIQQLFLRNFCQGITNDSRQGIWLDQMYSDTGTLTVLTVTQSETGQSSGKLLHKSGLAPPKSDESIWIYGAESRTQPSAWQMNGRKKWQGLQQATGNFATHHSSDGVISWACRQQPLFSHEWKLHACVEGD